MSAPWFLDALGLTGDADERAIKRAYATLLKTIDPAVAPDDFARLREAFELAKAWTTHQDAHRSDIPLQNVSSVSDAAPAKHADHPEEPTSPGKTATDGATQRLAALATALVTEPGTGTRVLLYRVTQGLRQQHVDALAAFEKALIDALREQRLVRRAELFSSAAAEFDWHEVGHLDTLGGQRCAWVEHVLASEVAWKALPEARRDRIMGLIADAGRQRDALPDHLVGAWPQVDAYMQLYGAWLRLSLQDEVRDAWVAHYTRLPTNRRKKLERAAERAMAPPASWRRWLTLGSGWSWSWRRALLIFMLLRLLFMALRAMGVTSR